MKCRNIILIIIITILLVPTASSGDIKSNPTTLWDEFSDWFFNLFGVEPDLYFDLDNHDVLGDTQEYTLKTSIAEKDFDYEVKVLSKKANIEVWLEYKETCQRDVLITVPDVINGTKTTIEKEDYDCWIKVTKEEARTKLLSDNEFTKVRVRREWGEMPEENCLYVPINQPTYCEQRVDIILTYSDREYIEYAQFVMTSGSWNGIFSNTEESGGKIVLSADPSTPDYLTDLDDNYMMYKLRMDNNTDEQLNTTLIHNVGSYTANSSKNGFESPMWGEGKVGDGGLYCNGSNDWAIVAANLDNLKPSGWLDEGTLQFWVNPADDTQASSTFLTFMGEMNFQPNGTAGDCVVGGWCFSWKDTEGTTWGMPLTVPYNEWSLITHTWNDTAHWLYLDGVEIDTDVTSENVSSGLARDLVLCAGWNGASLHAKGYIDEFLVANRTLTAPEIANSYESKYSEGNFTSVGYCLDDTQDWDEFEWFATVDTDLTSEYRSSADNSTWSAWANATNGVDIGVDGKECLQIRNNLANGDTELEYDNVTHSASNAAPNDAINLKINATTDNNYTEEDVYAEFKVGSEPEGDAVVYNITWYKDGVLNITFGNLTNSTALTLETLESENTTQREDWAFSIINCDIPTYECSSEVYSTNITIRSQPPTIPTINIPLDNSTIGNSSVMLNCSNSTDQDGDTIYYEFYVDWDTSSPSTQVNITEYGWHNWTTNGNFWYRCRANDSTEYSPYTIPIYFQMDSRKIFNATLNYSEIVYETENHNYNITLTINKWNTENISAIFTYNNTDYLPTRTAGLSNDDLAIFTFDRTLQTQLLGDVTLTGIWNFTLDLNDGTTEYNDTHTFTNEVSKIELAECNTTLTSPFINFTFKDEDIDEYINASIKSSTFIYTLDPAKALTKTLSFVNNTDQFSYAFCFDPLNKTLYTDVDLNYDSEGYPQRGYSDFLALTNTTLNKLLWLVASGDGIYVTFQVINTAEQPISDVNVNITRTISGTTYVIESGDTGADGGFTTWLNPDLTYTATFTSDSYDTYTTSQKFTQSTYTITLGGVVEGVLENVTNLIQGIDFTIEPTLDVLYNDTNYNFNFTITSTYWDLERSGFVLTNSTDDVLGSASCTTGTGCTSSVTVNMVNYTSVEMNYYWLIEGNYSNGTRSWMVYTVEDLRRGSFQNLVSDMDKLGSGFNDFTKAVFAFFIILFVVGGLSYWSGVYSPMAILVEVFFLVTFLDLINFIPTVGVDHFIPVLIGLIAVGYFIYEYTR